MAKRQKAKRKRLKRMHRQLIPALKKAPKNRRSNQHQLQMAYRRGQKHRNYRMAYKMVRNQNRYNQLLQLIGQLLYRY